MNNELTQQWKNNLKILDVAFQPIINIHTGTLYGVEALLRNFQDVGFKSIFSLFDAVYKEKLLYSFDLALREKALKKYTQIQNYKNIKLFYNLDNRVLEMENFSTGNTTKILQELNIKKENLCFEISERQEISSEFDLEKILQHYKNEDFSIAIDDFGVGYSGYKLFYDSTPDIIKIDRFFLQGLEKNMKKKLMVRNITHLAIQLGIKVIAEGVETKEEYLTCKDIGCHLAQGYLIQKPTKNTQKIYQQYANIIDIIKFDRRISDKNILLKNNIDKIQPLNIKTKMNLVIEYFKKNQSVPIVPLVNSQNEPVGILLESDIKEFLYSPYGMSLLLNEQNNSKLENLLHPCGHADINSNTTTLIELFANNPESSGIIITKNSGYYGFLSAKAIINMMHQENMIQARDQNPLTKLPGNTMIEKYIYKVSQSSASHLLCYFDLDNFKAFNDVYGFRNGDRIIQLFADILKKELPKDVFKAHIGGDDFFVAWENKNFAHSSFDTKMIENILEKFASSAKEFYSKKDKENGYIVSKNRKEQTCRFPLLTASASLLITPEKKSFISEESINTILSCQKKVAKNEPKHLAVSSLI
ncbi:GGDEF domain-containing protein [Sulfurimonas sp. SWIR-19]|uniref:GGDEF domain-containing protein n=1 Tax=Sulfurimonas sp. SWIR-19 TaxID=2878390 RepID=UPI001CF10D6C|nr:GGDEF domain-containing protein [Sulfurimonas sp. SWIR-19]UCM99963.1 GGDEF domain-containing protein [Sulfurimonas sp. SWIR-19]